MKFNTIWFKRNGKQMQVRPVSWEGYLITVLFVLAIVLLAIGINNDGVNIIEKIYQLFIVTILFISGALLRSDVIIFDKSNKPKL
jgi:hypothetical protein